MEYTRKLKAVLPAPVIPKADEAPKPDAKPTEAPIAAEPTGSQP
jgi:hypothetical protein